MKNKTITSVSPLNGGKGNLIARKNPLLTNPLNGNLRDIVHDITNSLSSGSMVFNVAKISLENGDGEASYFLKEVSKLSNSYTISRINLSTSLGNLLLPEMYDKIDSAISSYEEVYVHMEKAAELFNPAEKKVSEEISSKILEYSSDIKILADTLDNDFDNLVITYPFGLSYEPMVKADDIGKHLHAYFEYFKSYRKNGNSLSFSTSLFPNQDYELLALFDEKLLKFSFDILLNYAYSNSKKNVKVILSADVENANVYIEYDRDGEHRVDETTIFESRLANKIRISGKAENELYYCKKAIEQMDGQIYVENERGVSRFSLLLPIVEPD
ncbi:MAG: hypothetical protein ABIH83_03245 [Candidatus Micrarchaeota archaeon]